MQQDSRGRFVKGSHWRQPKPHWDREWLHREYVGRARSTGDIAHDCGCTDANIIYWLRRHDIPRRSVSAARAVKHWGLSGADNPMYGKTGAANPRFVDGSSPERQSMYARGDGRGFLRSVLQRDGYACRRCAAPKSEPKSLHVHHIRPWAGNAHLRFDHDNAVTLCRSCHCWVHSKQNSAKEFLA
jgi:hypothetical protein